MTVPAAVGPPVAVMGASKEGALGGLEATPAAPKAAEAAAMARLAVVANTQRVGREVRAEESRGAAATEAGD